MRIFGFAKPHALSLPFDTRHPLVDSSVYPARTKRGASREDEGNEFSIGFEKELTQDLVEDPEWNKYFEFRGVDAEEKVAVSRSLHVFQTNIDE